MKLKLLFFIRFPLVFFLLLNISFPVSVASQELRNNDSQYSDTSHYLTMRDEPLKSIGESNHPIIFGIIADIQYGDKDDRISEKGNRYFRTAIGKLEECVEDLNKRELQFVIQLGDIIEGHKGSHSKTHADLDSVVGVINRLNKSLYHVIGNHDMVWADWEYLLASLGMKRPYYDFSTSKAGGWRFIVLYGGDQGKMDKKQIDWFRSIINKADQKGERVICFCHYASNSNAVSRHSMAEPEPILEILDNSECVVAWFAGHDHSGGYAFRNGVHHITMKGMVEAPLENAYGIVELFPDKIRITGIGKEESRELLLHNLTETDRDGKQKKFY